MEKSLVPTIKSNSFLIIYIVVIIPLAGELNFYPFNDHFRVSFGMPTFFFFLLISRNKLSPFLSGIIVGIFVVFFRILLDLPTLDFSDSFQLRYPTFFYYFTFGSLYQFTGAKHYIQKPILIGVLGVLFDILASIGELTFQYISFTSITTLADIHKISVIAVFRSFFVVGFLNLLLLYKTRLKEEEMQKQNDELTIIISNLYEESINLKKTLVSSEKVTAEAYHLYALLKEKETEELEADSSASLHHIALKIAGEIHEIKKDNQRIFAGLSRLITDKGFSKYMDINKLLTIALESNKKYATLLGKEIKFTCNIEGEHPEYHAYQIFSMLNNILANSIEAIKGSGKIAIHIFRQDDEAIFEVKDNGPGIPSDKLQLVFKPGFTNKYDRDGSAYTGIGLTYVKGLVNNLGGNIYLHNREDKVSGLICKIQLPIQGLISKG